jgi:hypothetical protein
MDHVLPWGASPIDLPGDAPQVVHEPDGSTDLPAPRPSGVGWTVGAVATSSLMLLVFNSHALANWADQLPVAPLTAPLVTMADDWHARAGQLGLNDVVSRVERAAAAMRDAQWPQPFGQTRSADPAQRPATGDQR